MAYQCYLLRSDTANERLNQDLETAKSYIHGAGRQVTAA